MPARGDPTHRFVACCVMAQGKIARSSAVNSTWTLDVTDAVVALADGDVTSSKLRIVGIVPPPPPRTAASRKRKQGSNL